MENYRTTQYEAAIIRSNEHCTEKVDTTTTLVISPEGTVEMVSRPSPIAEMWVSPQSRANWTPGGTREILRMNLSKEEMNGLADWFISWAAANRVYHS